MRRYYIIILVVLLSFSCADNSREEFISLSVFQDSTSKLNFESIKLVQLSTGSDHVVGNTVLMKLYNNQIYILDISGQKCVLRFNQIGNFLNKIGHQGRGGEEYINPRDFLISNDTLSILTTNGENSKIISYQLDGSYINTLNVDLVANSFERTTSGYIINTGYNTAYHPYRYYTINSTGEIEHTFLKNDNKLEIPVKEENFFPYGTKIYIHEAFDNSLYCFESGELDKTFALDFGQYNIPDEFYTISLREGFALLNNRGFGNVKNYFENDNYAVFEIIVQKQGSDPHVYQYVYDKVLKNKYIHSFLVNTNDPEPFRRLVSLNSNDELIYLLYPIEITENLGAFEKLDLIGDFDLQRLNEMDNPIVAYCKIERNEK